jgi:hypothetical protein
MLKQVRNFRLALPLFLAGAVPGKAAGCPGAGSAFVPILH